MDHSTDRKYLIHLIRYLPRKQKLQVKQQPLFPANEFFPSFGRNFRRRSLQIGVCVCKRLRLSAHTARLRAGALIRKGHPKNKSRQSCYDMDDWVFLSVIRQLRAHI